MYHFVGNHFRQREKEVLKNKGYFDKIPKALILIELYWGKLSFSLKVLVYLKKKNCALVNALTKLVSLR